MNETVRTGASGRIDTALIRLMKREDKAAAQKERMLFWILQAFILSDKHASTDYCQFVVGIPKYWQNKKWPKAVEDLRKVAQSRIDLMDTLEEIQKRVTAL